jgi:hypothetical protein
MIRMLVQKYYAQLIEIQTTLCVREDCFTREGITQPPASKLRSNSLGKNREEDIPAGESAA